MPAMLILGCGYCGTWLARSLQHDGWQIYATTRSAEHAETLSRQGIQPLLVRTPADLPRHVLQNTDAVLDSIPLQRNGERMRETQSAWLPLLTPWLEHLRWAGYLSTTGVYGDAGGAWVDETSLCRPASQRGKQRLRAEQAWLDSGLPVEIFRLAGIYGPGRNIVAKLRTGHYRVVRWSPPHYASRIHIEDIVRTIRAAMHSPQSGRIINVADDLPLPHDQYASELAAYINAPAPVVLSPAEAERALSPALLDFFRDNKRVSNRKLHEQLLPQLHYPSFRHAWHTLLDTTSA